MNKVKNITLAVLITVIGAARAQEVSTSETEANRGIPGDIQVVSGANARYKLVYPIKKTETVWIEIYDSHKHLLLSESVKNQEGFMKSYDFSNLSDGVYTINIQARSGILTKEVYHKYHQNDIDFSIEKNPENKSFRLIVRGVKNDPVYVDILDKKNHTIFEDKVEVGKSFSRVYKFEDALPESMMIRVSSADKTITKEVK